MVSSRSIVAKDADLSLRFAPKHLSSILLKYQGKRLNSPNDLVYRSDGTLYFTDPPFGLPRFFEDPRKELPFSGVFSWKDGRLRLLTHELKDRKSTRLNSSHQSTSRMP